MANTGRTHWSPGQSGNPSGRPARTKEFKAKLARYMEEEGGLDKLIAIANGDGDPKDQLKALQYVADHVYGKATQVIAGPDADDEHQPLLLHIIQRETKS